MRAKRGAGWVWVAALAFTGCASTVEWPAIEAAKPPTPRPVLTSAPQNRPPSPGAPAAEISGIDPKWNGHGDYLRRMTDAVQLRWERALVQLTVKATKKGQVAVIFVLDSQGKVVEIVDVESTSSDAVARACVNSITAAASYGPWTPEMKTALGERQRMTFIFHYE